MWFLAAAAAADAQLTAGLLNDCRSALLVAYVTLMYVG
jgi:hypothetical protein